MGAGVAGVEEGAAVEGSGKVDEEGAEVFGVAKVEGASDLLPLASAWLCLCTACFGIKVLERLDWLITDVRYLDIEHPRCFFGDQGNR